MNGLKEIEVCARRCELCEEKSQVIYKRYSELAIMIKVTGIGNDV